MNMQAKTIQIQFITYPVRLSDVLRMIISVLAVWLKALSLALGAMALSLALGAMALALKVQALALRVEPLVLALRFWPWLHHCHCVKPSLLWRGLYAVVMESK